MATNKRFPNSGKIDGKDFSQYFIENTWGSKESKEKMRAFRDAYKETYLPNFHLWTGMYSRAYEHMSMYLGSQNTHSEIEAKKLQRRSALTFNHIFRVINSIAGYFDQSQLGYSVQSTSPDESGTRTADILSDCLRNLCYRQDVYNKISTAVREACITGWSGLRAYVDYTPGVGMEINVRNLSWSNMIIDPWLTQRDLSDCGYIAIRSLLPRSKLVGMFPNKASEIMRLQAGPPEDPNFPWAPQARMPLLDKNRLNYTEMYRMVSTSKEFLFDPDTGDLTEWDGDDALFRRVRVMYPRVSLVKREVPAIEYGVMIQDQLMFFSENPYGCNCYPIQPFFAIFEPSFEVDRKIQSLVSIVADSQRAYNKRKNALLDILDTNLQSGVIYKEGAVVNPDSLYMIRAGHNICVKPQYAIPDAIQQVSPVDVPTSIFQATQDLETNINTLLGVNPEMFGQTQGGSEQPVEMSGVLYRMKQASALTGMQPFFSSVRDAQKHFGEILLKIIMANYTPQKYQEISKKEPTVELTMKNWAKYNIVVQEGLIENRNSNLEQKLALRQLGVPISTRSIIEDAPVYGKEDLIQYAEAQEQAQGEMQQLQIEKERMTIENLAQDLRSEAAKNQADALETLSSIGAKAAEKEEALARAQKIKADTVSQFASVLKQFSEAPPERLQMALQFMGQMLANVENSIEQKKVIVEHEADRAIEMRLPPQDLGEETQQQGAAPAMQPLDMGLGDVPQETM